MEHTQAVTIGATERYLLGELDERESAAFEEHYFSCAECAADVRAASAVADGATLLLQGDLRASGGAARPPGRVLRGPASWFWPMPMGAVAALLLACVGLAWQGLALRDLRGELVAADAPQPAGSAFLSASRSEVQEVPVRPEDRWVHLRLAPVDAAAADVRFHRYRLVRKDTGSVLWSAVHRAPRPGDESELNVPLKGLRPGPYVLKLDGLQSSAEPAGVPDLARYEFSLRYRGE